MEPFLTPVSCVTGSRGDAAADNPEWDEDLEFDGEFEQLTSAPLHLKVMDSDVIGADFLGEVSRTHDKYVPRPYAL